MARTSKKQLTPTEIARRHAFEAQFAEVPKIDPAVLKLLSTDGFARYFTEIRNLYSSHAAAYEYLEGVYTGITGMRHYSSYNSFRKVLSRKLTK